MDIFYTTYEAFKNRYEFKKDETPKNPLRIYSDPDAYYLFWTDTDNKIIGCEIERTSFATTEDERDFKMQYLDKALPLVSMPGEEQEDEFEEPVESTVADIIPS